jgi:hypothetical protein
MNLSSDQVELIHKAIHGRKPNGEPYNAVKLSGAVYPVRVAPRSKCRYVLIDPIKIKFVEQNKTTETKHASKALTGTQITWAIPLERRGRWGKIEDGVIITPIPGVEAEG